MLKRFEFILLKGVALKSKIFFQFNWLKMSDSLLVYWTSRKLNCLHLREKHAKCEKLKNVKIF